MNQSPGELLTPCIRDLLRECQAPEPNWSAMLAQLNELRIIACRMTGVPDETQILRTENARLKANSGFSFVFTKTQAQLFADLCAALLSGKSLGAATDTLLRSIQRRLEKALKRGVE